MGLIKRVALFAVLLCTGLLGGTLSVASESRLQVVATTGMVTDVVREIGGDQVVVEGLMGPGVDPHLYRQTRRDITALSRADAVFWNGLYLEAQLEEFLERLAKRRPVYAVAESVPEHLRLVDEAYQNQSDPHVWMDPGRWRYVVEAVRDALVELRPEQKAHFERRADSYLVELDKLDAYARRVLNSVPESKRVLMTAHDAFGYFGDAFGFEVLGIQGFSTESEAGLSRIEALVDLLVERKIEAIFVESSVSDRNVRALIEGAAARGHSVRIGGELYSDAMGPAGTYEGTWLGMIDHNVSIIAQALGGEVPPGGRLGKLQHAEATE